jgi:uncharacterized protein (DUF3084 family)
VDIDYGVLAQRAKELSEKRVSLEAQCTALEKQVKELEASLVADFGEDYMASFYESVAAIQSWEASHA